MCIRDRRKRDRQFWKFNNSLLRDNKYTGEVKKVISELINEHMLPVYNLENIENVPNDQIQFTISDQLFCEMLLLKICAKTISYACYKKKADSAKETELESKISDLSSKVNLGNIEELEQLKTELEELRKKKTEGIIIRSRVKWIQEGEKPSQYFCSLENRNFVDRSMSFLVNNDGSVISSQTDILKEVQYFYENLYSEQDVRNVNLFRNIKNANKLTQEESELLDGPLTAGNW